MTGNEMGKAWISGQPPHILIEYIQLCVHYHGVLIPRYRRDRLDHTCFNKIGCITYLCMFKKVIVIAFMSFFINAPLRGAPATILDV
jgi:hypothetical protein